MKTPFSFGKIVSEENFTNRVMEKKRLITNFSSSVNTILISPRRWGKSSLVSIVSGMVSAADKKTRFCFIDLNNIRTEEQFYQELAARILKSTATGIEKIVDSAKKFLGRFMPQITFSPGPDTDFRLGLDWKEVKGDPSIILDLAENIAIESKLRIIVCIDEFQNISGFEDPLAFQKMLRAHWQKHQHVTYCLYGSKRHMLMDVFTSPSMPFYKFGDILFLQKIAVSDWIPFIIGKFKETGKSIGADVAMKITALTECHPYYVQQLAQQSWFRTVNECTEETVNDAFEDLVSQLGMLFQTITDNLNGSQVNFLMAVTENTEHYSSQASIQKYRLGTSANVLKLKKALVNKEILEIDQGIVTFLDPLYRYWLIKYYFDNYPVSET
jgi:hypothetical protein